MNDGVILHWDEEKQCYLDNKMNPWFNGENIPCTYPHLFNEYAKRFVEQHKNRACEAGHIEMDNEIDETLASLHPNFAKGIYLLRSMESIWYA